MEGPLNVNALLDELTLESIFVLMPALPQKPIIGTLSAFLGQEVNLVELDCAMSVGPREFWKILWK